MVISVKTILPSQNPNKSLQQMIQSTATAASIYNMPAAFLI
jgi:hypothetical protein